MGIHNWFERTLKYSIEEGLEGAAGFYFEQCKMNSEDCYTGDYWGEYYDSAEFGGTPLSNEQQFVCDLVKNHKVVVFSKTQCPHCSDSKSLLSTKGVSYKTIELDKMEDGGQVQNVLGQMTNARTVPRIFIDGQCVGGNSDLKNLNETGKLEKILNEEM